MPRFTFSKEEHIVSKLDIEALFSKGSSAFNSFPVRIVFREVEESDFPAKVLISVSKRHFKHAVDRNRAKRQIREAYRLNKDILWSSLQESGKKIHIAFLWLSDNPVSSEKVTHSIQKLLHLTAEKL